MISKFSKMRDSWFTKAILTITALSFISLFGVTGYINTANNNRTVIKVDDIELSQSEFSYLLQREISKIKALTDDDIASDDELHDQIANSLLQAKLNEAILDNTMKKYHIDFKASLISSIILRMPQFAINGRFDNQQYKWYLNRMGMNENELVANIKRDLAKSILIDSQVAFAKVPEILRKQMQKVMGERRTFKYAKISPNDAKITRTPTDEELEQYYDDLKEEFTEQETRDIELFFLSQDDLEKNIKVSDEEIDAYYKEHIEEYEQPEKRFVLQMVFDNEDEAQDAYKRVSSGGDFVEIATAAGQQKSDVELGYVAQNDLIPELADAVFSLADGLVSEPLKIDNSWQVIKVQGIQKPQKTDAKKAREEITSILKQEKVYDGNYDIIDSIEDQIGAGKQLSEIAKGYNKQLHSLKNISDDSQNNNVTDEKLSAVLQDKDLLEEIFSYNEGEITKVLETDEGIVAAYISQVNVPHLLPFEDVKEKLNTIWLENEKSSVIQELVDNVEHDIEAGDDVLSVAKRYNLQVKNTMPVTRAENFAELSFEAMRELFSMPKNYPTVLTSGDDYILAETTNIYDDTASLSENDKRFLDEALASEMAQEMSDALLKDFASDYKIEVNYSRAGLSE